MIRSRRKQLIKSDSELKEKSHKLYEKYGRPLESEHLGEYLAVAEDGRLLLGHDLVELAKRAEAKLGPGVFMFKVGGPAVGKWLLTSVL